MKTEYAFPPAYILKVLFLMSSDTGKSLDSQPDQYLYKKKKKGWGRKNYIFKKKIVKKQYSLLYHFVSEDVHFFPPKYKPKKENLDKDRPKTRKCIKEPF